MSTMSTRFNPSERRQVARRLARLILRAYELADSKWHQVKFDGEVIGSNYASFIDADDYRFRMAALTEFNKPTDRAAKLAEMVVEDADAETANHEKPKTYRDLAECVYFVPPYCETSHYESDSVRDSNNAVLQELCDEADPPVFHVDEIVQAVSLLRHRDLTEQIEKLADYPVLDDDHRSELESLREDEAVRDYLAADFFKECRDQEVISEAEYDLVTDYGNDFLVSIFYDFCQFTQTYPEGGDDCTFPYELADRRWDTAYVDGEKTDNREAVRMFFDRLVAAWREARFLRERLLNVKPDIAERLAANLRSKAEREYARNFRAQGIRHILALWVTDGRSREALKYLIVSLGIVQDDENAKDGAIPGALSESAAASLADDVTSALAVIGDAVAEGLLTPWGTPIVR